VSPLLIYSCWKLVVKKWIALVLVIQLMLITNFDYKTLALNLLIPLVIYIVRQSYFQDENNLWIRIRQLFYGGIIGSISMLYFGYIYWLTPFLIVVIITSLFSTKRFKLLELISYFYLGLGFALGPMIHNMAELDILQFYALILASILFLEFSRKYFKFFKYIHIFTSMLITFILFRAFFQYRAFDTWFEGGIADNNPSVNAILSLEKINLLLLGLLIFLIFKFLVDTDLSMIISIVLVIYLSSTIFMYLIASQMQVSRRVDLWPRAQEVQNYSVNLIFLLVSLFIVDTLAKKYNLEEFISTASNAVLLPATFGLVLIGSYFVSTLGGQAYYSMPYHALNGAWYAHQGCSNPHKDPMLTKVFENYPDIQDFLRAKCSSVTWEKIPAIK
jgi:hypothetical protein